MALVLDLYLYHLSLEQLALPSTSKSTRHQTGANKCIASATKVSLLLPQFPATSCWRRRQCVKGTSGPKAKRRTKQTTSVWGLSRNRGIKQSHVSNKGPLQKKGPIPFPRLNTSTQRFIVGVAAQAATSPTANSRPTASENDVDASPAPLSPKTTGAPLRGAMN